VTDKDKITLDVGGESLTLSPDQIKEVAKEALLDTQDEQDRLKDQQDARKMDDTINQVEKLATDATQTEFFKEQLLQKEQALKEQEDLKKLDRAIQKQQEKLKCIELMTKKEQAKQNQRLMQVQHNQEVREIRNEVQNQVNNIKHVFNSKLSGMLQETQKIRQQKMKNLMELKLRITRMLIDKQTKGDISNCEVDSQAKRNGYCNAKFSGDWFENKYCRQSDNFCGVCCDKEFSSNYREEKEKCILTCRNNNRNPTGQNGNFPDNSYQANVELV